MSQVIKVFLFSMFLFYNGSCVAGEVKYTKQSNYIYKGNDGSVLIYPQTYEWLGCVLGFVLLGTSVAGYSLSDNEQAQSVSISGIISGTIISVFGMPYAIKNYLERYKPLIKLDQQGISFRGRFVESWKNVTNIDIRRYRYELALESKNNFQDISLDLMHLPEDANQFLKRVKRFWNENKNK